VIVRIMEEDQYRLDDQEATEFEQLDHTLLEAVHASDQAAFLMALNALLGFVRDKGAKVPYTEIVPSDAVVPAEDMTLAEAKELLDADTSTGA
jgi:hypothetical protein